LNQSQPGPVPLNVRLAIEDLMTEFSHRVDNGLGASVHELFTADGSIATPAFVLADPDAIRERFTARGQDVGRKTRHYWSNPRFVYDGEQVTCFTNVMTVVATAGHPGSVMSGSSTDTFALEGGAWRFRSRSLEVIFNGELQSPAVRA